jgi:hypothetical protein
MVLGKRLQFAAARRLGAIPLAVLLLLGGVGAPLVASRTAELEETCSAKNRVEELSLGHRVSAQRQLRQEAGRVSASLMPLAPRSLGHAQNPVFNALGGHRMPNGLLAPMTC